MAVCSLWNDIGGRPYMWKKYRGLGKVSLLGSEIIIHERGIIVQAPLYVLCRTKVFLEVGTQRIF